MGQRRVDGVGRPKLDFHTGKDAELHLALGAKLAAKGDGQDASALWETGCVRLRTYVDDATARIIADDAKTDGLSKDPAAAARGLAAFSVGLDPKNPYVTQQTNTQFLWYELDVESNLYRQPDSLVLLTGTSWNPTGPAPRTKIIHLQAMPKLSGAASARAATTASPV